MPSALDGEWPASSTTVGKVAMRTRLNILAEEIDAGGFYSGSTAGKAKLGAVETALRAALAEAQAQAARLTELENLPDSEPDWRPLRVTGAPGPVEIGAGAAFKHVEYTEADDSDFIRRLVLPVARAVTISLKGGTDTTQVYFYRAEANWDLGTLVTSTPTTSPKSVTVNLAAGNYYIGAYTPSGSRKRYRIDVVAGAAVPIVSSTPVIAVAERAFDGSQTVTTASSAALRQAAGTLAIDITCGSNGRAGLWSIADAANFPGRLQVWLDGNQVNAAAVGSDGAWRNVWAGPTLVSDNKPHRIVVRWGDGHLLVDLDSLTGHPDAVPSAPFAGGLVSERSLVVGAENALSTANTQDRLTDFYTGRLGWKLYDKRLSDQDVAVLFGEDATALKPLVRNDAITLVKNSAATDVDVLGNDAARAAGGDPLTISTVGKPSATGASASVVGNKLRYRPPSGYTGSDQVSYTVKDSRGNTASALLKVTVRAVEGATSLDAPPNRTDFLVGTEAEWRTAEAAVRPGQVIRIKNGNYTGRSLKLGAVTSGTADAPIWICPETPGGVILGSGSQFASFADHRIWHGFTWVKARNGYQYQINYAVPGGTRKTTSFPGSHMCFEGVRNNTLQSCRLEDCAAVNLANNALAQFVMMVGWYGNCDGVKVRNVAFVRSQTCPIGLLVGSPANSLIEDCTFIGTGSGVFSNQMTDIGLGTGQAANSSVNVNTVDFVRGKPLTVRRCFIEDSGCIESITPKMSDVIVEDCIQIGNRNGANSRGFAGLSHRTGGYGVYRRNFLVGNGYNLMVCGPGHLYEQNIVIDAWRGGVLSLHAGVIQGSRTSAGGDVKYDNAWNAVTDSTFRRNTVVGRKTYQGFQVNCVYLENYISSEVTWNAGNGRVGFHRPITWAGINAPWAKDNLPARNRFTDNIFQSGFSHWLNGSGALLSSNYWTGTVVHSTANASVTVPSGASRQDPRFTWRRARITTPTGDGPFEFDVPFPALAGKGADPNETLKAWDITWMS
ncbi:Ig-like domain-containing protein [Marinivivus vitaminiproducens]|uniref:Ig-like domain-containing protein n=1 Tax=Marinivivus vitaminiproducens TaxID=3035935 RepID=UPI0027A6030F|nr:Ig-like domain-containing protein [Geminicoccaceae bacterium SCSIO 64248]